MPFPAVFCEEAVESVVLTECDFAFTSKCPTRVKASIPYSSCNRRMVYFLYKRDTFAHLSLSVSTYNECLCYC